MACQLRLTLVQERHNQHGQIGGCQKWQSVKIDSDKRKTCNDKIYGKVQRNCHASPKQTQSSVLLCLHWHGCQVSACIKKGKRWQEKHHGDKMANVCARPKSDYYCDDLGDEIRPAEVLDCLYPVAHKRFFHCLNNPFSAHTCQVTAQNSQIRQPLPASCQRQICNQAALTEQQLPKEAQLEPNPFPGMEPVLRQLSRHLRH